MFANFTREIGAKTLFFIDILGQISLLLMKLISHIAVVIKRPRQWLFQMYVLGNQSLLIMLTAGIFVGFVLSLQAYYVLSRYGSAQALGVMTALALLRELGPVITALLFAGRAGSALSAEIGLMKSSEQILALEMMAVNPIQTVLAPRFWAGVIVLPGLALIFNAIAIWGAYLMAVVVLGIDANAFWGHMQSAVDFYKDVLNGLVKSFVFGALTTLIALYQGFNAHPTPQGVARATTLTVVWGCLATLIADFILTAMMFV
jgi:phospholipid/cholesterol/gamma-HCH transport system permease protein